MAESKDKKAADAPKQITRRDRLHFIGFDVFPGDGAELFSSDAEREHYLSEIKKKRSRGDIIRDACTLLGERISFSERIILAAAALLTIGSLFLPWYSAYNEIEEDVQIDNVVIQEPADSVPAGSLALAGGADSLATSSGGAAGAVTQPDELADLSGEDVAADNSSPGAAVERARGVSAAAAEVTGAGIRGDEEIITSQQFKANIHREYSHIGGFSAFVKLGSLSSQVFSAGIVVIVSVLLMIVYALLCILFPVFILYNVFGLKGDADEVALKLKKVFSYGWIPVLLFFAVMFLSLIGGSYGPTTVGTFTSLGDSYSVSVFLSVLSWGAFVSLIGFIVIAVKGVEI